MVLHGLFMIFIFYIVISIYYIVISTYNIIYSQQPIGRIHHVDKLLHLLKSNTY